MTLLGGNLATLFIGIGGGKQAQSTLTRFTFSATQAGVAGDRLERTTRRLNYTLGGFAGLFAARSLINAADTFTLLHSRMKLVSFSAGQANRALEAVYNAAQFGRTSLEATGVLFHRLALQAIKLGISLKEVEIVTRAVNAANLLSGSTGVEAAQSMRQLAQALSKGKLDGDEFRTVMEAMPIVATSLEEHMRRLGHQFTSLYDLAPQGILTAQVFVEAMIASHDEWAARVSEMPITISQAWTYLSNALKRTLGIINQTTNGTTVFGKVIVSIADNITVLVATLGALMATLGGLAILRIGASLILRLSAVTKLATLAFYRYRLAFDQMLVKRNWATYNSRTRQFHNATGRMIKAEAALGRSLARFRSYMWRSSLRIRGFNANLRTNGLPVFNAAVKNSLTSFRNFGAGIALATKNLVMFAQRGLRNATTQLIMFTRQSFAAIKSLGTFSGAAAFSSKALLLLSRGLRAASIGFVVLISTMGALLFQLALITAATTAFFWILDKIKEATTRWKKSLSSLDNGLEANAGSWLRVETNARLVKKAVDETADASVDAVAKMSQIDKVFAGGFVGQGAHMYSQADLNEMENGYKTTYGRIIRLTQEFHDATRKKFHSELTEQQHTFDNIGLEGALKERNEIVQQYQRDRQAAHQDLEGLELSSTLTGLREKEISALRILSAETLDSVHKEGDEKIRLAEQEVLLIGLTNESLKIAQLRNEAINSRIEAEKTLYGTALNAELASINRTERILISGQDLLRLERERTESIKLRQNREDERLEIQHAVKLIGLSDEKQKYLEIEYETKRRILEVNRQLANSTSSRKEVEAAKALAHIKYLERMEKLIVKNELAVKALNEEREIVQATLKEQEVALQRFLDNFQEGFANTFEKVVQNGIKSFADMFNLIRRLFVRMISDLLAAKVIDNLSKPLENIYRGIVGSLEPSGTGLTMTPTGMLLPRLVKIDSITRKAEVSFSENIGKAILPALAGFAVGTAVGGQASNTLTGSVAGGISGGATGYAIGGPFGAVIGGITGAIGGLIGAIKARNLSAKKSQQIMLNNQISIDKLTRALNAQTRLSELIESRDRLSAYKKATVDQQAAFDARRRADAEKGIFGRKNLPISFKASDIDPMVLEAAQFFGIQLLDDNGKLIAGSLEMLAKMIDLTIISLTELNTSLNDTRLKYETMAKFDPDMTPFDVYDKSFKESAPNLYKYLGLEGLKPGSKEYNEALQHAFMLWNLGEIPPELLAEIGGVREFLRLLGDGANLFNKFNNELSQLVTDFPRVQDITRYEHTYGEANERNNDISTESNNSPQFVVGGDVIIRIDVDDVKNGVSTLETIENELRAKLARGGSTTITRGREF